MNVLTKEEFYDKYLKDRSDDRFLYMLLDRMRSDCNYCLAYNTNKYLWAHDDPVAQIAYMRYLYDFVPEKPEWLTAEQIDEYEKRFSERKICC